MTTKAGNSGGQLFPQVLCDTGLSTCPPGSNYPKPNGTVVLKRLPIGLPTMPNPCAGVLSNPWCPNGAPLRHGHHGPPLRRSGRPTSARGSRTRMACQCRAGWDFGVFFSCGAGMRP